MIHDNYVNWEKKEYLNTDTFFCAVTRFNIRMLPDMTDTQFQEFSINRLTPFIKVCAPSIHYQRLPLHRWYVMFDESFRNTVEQIRPAVAFPGFTPVFVPADVKKAIEACQQQIRDDSKGREYAASISHDSDDALSYYFSAFLDDIIAAARKTRQPPFAVNFPYQLRLDGEKLAPYVATDSSSVALWEKADSAKTSYQKWHSNLSEYLPVLECGTRFPMVLITRNDSNIGQYAWQDMLPLENKGAILKNHFGIEG